MQSLRKGAAIIRKRTKSLAPRDTGVLRKSIITRTARKSRNFPGVKALLQLFNTKNYPELIRYTKGSAFSISTHKQVLGRRAFYPAAVEYGRSAKGNPRGAKITRPKSFVRAGFHSSKKQAEVVIIRALKLGIEKAWREQ